ncbi:helix-turn-helix transcriptional regulator [Phytomonospora sp. NPDC050363]|uniref:helix-turn-helix domain-containing protein n=1 Tax=Phytomonospora sp. NPDC050363 TaxID=3155642 RepID=UPI0034079DF6
MLNRNDPKALRWLLGAQIASFRHDAGLSLAQLRELTGVSRAKLGTMETGRFGQNADDVALILEACGAPKDDITRLSTMARRIGGRSWWAKYADVLPDWFTLYAGLEGLAESLFTMELWAMPGILQTEAYARAVTGSTSLVRPDHVERFARFRTERSARLTDAANPLRLDVVLAETAFRVQVGGPDVMAAQFDHVLDLIDSGGVSVQILLPEAGARPVGAGQLTLLRFDDGFEAAYTELIDGASYVSAPAKARAYRWAADEIQRVALTPEESLKQIRAWRKRM